jgi:hypothetical protein
MGPAGLAAPIAKFPAQVLTPTPFRFPWFTRHTSPAKPHAPSATSTRHQLSLLPAGSYLIFPLHEALRPWCFTDPIGLPGREVNAQEAVTDPQPGGGFRFLRPAGFQRSSFRALDRF